MTQTVLQFDRVTFNAQLSREARDEGLGAAAWSRRELLVQVRAALVSIALARPGKTATADDGQKWLVSRGYQPGDLGNAAGAMFLSAEWEFTGQWVPSDRVSRRANMLRVWRLR